MHGVRIDGKNKRFVFPTQCWAICCDRKRRAVCVQIGMGRVGGSGASLIAGRHLH